MDEPAGDFEQDTAVEGRDGRYRANLTEDWQLWGPAGGYVSAIALRAAGTHSRFTKPASYSCNYLGVARFDPVDIEVSTLMGARRSEAIRVSMLQDGRCFLDATVWTIDEGMEGFVYDAVPMPELPGPDGIVPWQEYSPPPKPFRRFWSNLEERMIGPVIERWEDRAPGPPIREGWCRFRPKATFDDPFLDAARSLMIIDTMGWPAFMASQTGIPKFLAPTIELSARFHRPAHESEWLLGVTTSPVATGALVGSTAQVWAQDGAYVASGGQTLLCRPAPGT
ncbi:MAG: thioesterase family protein [Actinomycetota bacterium]